MGNNRHSFTLNWLWSKGFRAVLLGPEMGSMKRAALAGFAAGAAMVIGGALGAVSRSDPKPVPDINIEISNPMIGGQAMLPDRDIMDNISASPMHSSAGCCATSLRRWIRSIL